jgi:hypothetical protein
MGAKLLEEILMSCQLLSSPQGVGVLKEANDCSATRQRSHSNQELAEADSFHGRFDTRKSDKVTPLYQRVLSALIEEDEIEEFHLHGEGKNLSLQYGSDDSHCGSCNHIYIEPKDWDRMESEVESEVDYQAQKNYLLDRLSCDKSVASNSLRNPSMSSSLTSSEQWRGDDDFSHSDLGHASEICSNDLGQLQPRELNVGCLSSSNCQYQLLCLDDRLLLELQSIGLYPETLVGFFISYIESILEASWKNSACMVMAVIKNFVSLCCLILIHIKNFLDDFHGSN